LSSPLTPPDEPVLEAATSRALTVGLVLGVTVIALASLAVVTVAPRIPAELGGIERYGWIFAANLLATLVGTVWGGQQADRHGPGRAFVLGLVSFVAGSLVAALAPSMALLIVGRALQGLGGGAVITCIYVLVSLAFPDRGRARVLALLSSAWVLPALLGPAAAGFVAEISSWRWVFAALAPFAVLVALLTLPSFRAFARPRGAASVGDSGRLLAAFVLAVSVGALLWSLDATALPALRVVVAGLAVTLALLALRRLLPVGTIAARPGLGAVIIARGGLFAGFITVEVYLALMLSDVLGLSSTLTGVVIATGAVVWTSGSWAQARLEALATQTRLPGPIAALARRRSRRVQTGVAVLASGVAIQLLALALASGGVGAWSFALVILGWAVAGVGIGFAHASGSVLAFEHAEREGVATGTVSAALQLADGVAAATATGVAGALLAQLSPERGVEAGVAAAYLIGLAAVALSGWAAWRIDARSAGSSRAAA